jgi:hypothetical protein
MGNVNLRSALVTITVDQTPPRVTITSEERAEWPDPVDFLVVSDKPIAARSYSFVDDAGQTFRLGYESLDERTDLVICPSLGLAQGRGIFFITVADDVGNECRMQQQVAVVSPAPFDAAIGMQRIYMAVTRHQPVFYVETNSEEG